MSNWYAQAIDELEKIDGSLKNQEKLRRIAIDYAKRHPKAFAMAAVNAGGGLADRCKAIYDGGSKVEAVKLCRAETGKSLRDAKEWVESL